MTETSFTKLVGCASPVQLAPMPFVSTVELAAAVANAGGLGMLAAPLLTPAELEEQIDRLSAAASGPFGVNFLVPFLDRDCLAVAARGARVVDFFWGEPDAALVAAVHEGGALASWQVGSREEAVAAERAGCDLVAAQGTEAGGHVRGRLPLRALLRELRGALGVPVLAAGGIAGGGDLASALELGAAGARVGTRFVAASESGAHPTWVEALLRAKPEDTCLTEAFSVMWPDAPHRVLRSAVQAAGRSPEGPIGELRYGARAFPVERFSVVCPTRDTDGRVEAMALYAGESVARVNEVLPAAGIVARLVSGL